jgi:hypothetical protein
MLACSRAAFGIFGCFVAESFFYRQVVISRKRLGL